MLRAVGGGEEKREESARQQDGECRALGPVLKENCSIKGEDALCLSQPGLRRGRDKPP